LCGAFSSCCDTADPSIPAERTLTRSEPPNAGSGIPRCVSAFKHFRNKDFGVLVANSLIPTSQAMSDDQHCAIVDAISEPPKGPTLAFALARVSSLYINLMLLVVVG